MRILSSLFIILCMSTASYAAEKPKKLCFNTKVSVPIADWATADVAKLSAEKQLDGCTKYLAKFKKRKKERSGEATKKIRALLIRAKAHTILGNKAAAAADIELLRSLAEKVDASFKLSTETGVGLLLEAMEAINSETPDKSTADLAARHPYNEAIQQIALSYALVAEDYNAAAQYATLSDKLNESAAAAKLKGYILEIGDMQAMALAHYQDTTPSLEAYIRQAHIHLDDGDISRSREMYELALSIAEEKPLQKDIFAVLAARDDRGKAVTPMMKKRLNILQSLYKIDEAGANSVFQELFQMSTGFGHFELVSAMKFAARAMDNAPEHVMSLDSKPQFPEGFAPMKLRNQSLNKLQKNIVKGSAKTNKPRYRSAVSWLTAKGFKSEKNEDGSLSVSFESSAKADRPTITEMALLRAADLALEDGRGFFNIRDLNQYSRGMAFSDPVSYLVKMVIEFTDKEHVSSKTFDARLIKDQLGPKYMQ